MTHEMVERLGFAETVLVAVCANTRDATRRYPVLLIDALASELRVIVDDRVAASAKQGENARNRVQDWWRLVLEAIAQEPEPDGEVAIDQLSVAESAKLEVLIGEASDVAQYVRLDA